MAKLKTDIERARLTTQSRDVTLLEHVIRLRAKVQVLSGSEIQSVGLAKVSECLPGRWAVRSRPHKDKKTVLFWWTLDGWKNVHGSKVLDLEQYQVVVEGAALANWNLLVPPLLLVLEYLVQNGGTLLSP
jgi:hypothetical protein